MHPCGIKMATGLPPVTCRRHATTGNHALVSTCLLVLLKLSWQDEKPPQLLLPSRDVLFISQEHRELLFFKVNILASSPSFILLPKFLALFWEVISTAKRVRMQGQFVHSGPGGKHPEVSARPVPKDLCAVLTPRVRR